MGETERQVLLATIRSLREELDAARLELLHLDATTMRSAQRVTLINRITALLERTRAVAGR
jgi:hypothetical protein